MFKRSFCEHVTTREKALEFIAANQRDVKMGPTLRELATHLGVVPNAAQQHVAGLRTEGKVEDNDGRGIVLVAGQQNGARHPEDDKLAAARALIEKNRRRPLILKPSARGL